MPPAARFFVKKRGKKLFISRMIEERKVLIKGGTVVSDRSVSPMDILIEGERIAAMGDAAGLSVDVEIDARGLLVLPGAVDSHVHFNDVFMNTISVHDYYTGTLAAAYGGVTSVIDFSNQAKGESLMSTIDTKKKRSRRSGTGGLGSSPGDHTAYFRDLTRNSIGGGGRRTNH